MGTSKYDQLRALREARTVDVPARPPPPPIPVTTTPVQLVIKRGRPRLEVAHKTLAATKPWEKLGMSERTWYRRRRERRGD